MSGKQLRVAVCDVTLVSGTADGLWYDPDTVPAVSGDSSAVGVQIELEYAPTFFWAQRTNALGTTLGTLQITAVTANGFTITAETGGSPSAVQTADVSVVRVYAVCRAEDFGGA